MKQIINKILLAGVLLVGSIQLQAQTPSTGCDRNFTINTTITDASCDANGIVVVTLDGDVDNIMVERTEYALTPEAGTEGTTKLFSTSNVLSGLAPGKYIVSVRTFCIDNQEVGVVTEKTNVVVGGTYEALKASFDQTRMRKSYPNCPTGFIAFNLKENTGKGDRTFILKSAPAGVTLGEFIPKSSSDYVPGFIPYELEGLYPPGEYSINIIDDCSNCNLTFTLPQTTGLPSFSSSYSSMYPVYESCNKVSWRIGAPSNNENDHYYKHYIAGLYEIALLPAASTPTESDWIPYTQTAHIFELPGTYNDYFTSSSLKVYMRVKGCDANKVTASSNLKSPPLLSSSYSYFCGYYLSPSYIYLSDYDGFWCYPVTTKLTDTTTGTDIAVETFTRTSANTSGATFFSATQMSYGTTYRVTITDANGYQVERTYSVDTSNQLITLNFGQDTGKNTCTTFNGYFYTNSSLNCFPAYVDVYKQDESLTGTTKWDWVKQITLTSNKSGYDDYPYGIYKFKLTIPGILKPDGTPYTYETTSTIKPTFVDQVKLGSTIYSSTTSGACSYQHYGVLSLTYSGSVYKIFPPGTTVKVVSAPEGYKHTGKTFTYPYQASNLYLGESESLSTTTSIFQTYMPTGTYEVEVDTGCGSVLTASAELNTGFDAENVKFKVVDDGCNGARIMLDTDNGGYVTLAGGTPNASYTNFRVVAGSNGGYDPLVKRSTESILITADGTYTVGIMPNYSVYSHLLDITHEVEVTLSKPRLNPSTLASYVCTDPSTFTGTILANPEKGVPPYKLELLNADGTSTGLSQNNVAAGERVVFQYGEKGETYIIRITDACTNSTTQEVTLADLKTQSIIYSTPESGDFCTGGTIKLNCITLGQTTYEWSKQNADGTYTVISTDQNPRISNATVADGGKYRIKVTPEYCGEEIIDYLTVKVHPPLRVTAVSADQEVCLASPAKAMDCTVADGFGLLTYQWQSSTDGTTWTNITGATAAKYTPPYFTTPGSYYYRRVTSDECHMIPSDPITVLAKVCYIPVNPHIRSKVTY